MVWGKAAVCNAGIPISAVVRVLALLMAWGRQPRVTRVLGTLLLGHLGIAAIWAVSRRVEDLSLSFCLSPSLCDFDFQVKDRKSVV